MTLPVWGNLEKSQVDSETIEEAVARLIQAHEDDANAHVEIGESLQSHKAAETIDHIARSIVFDKISAAELVYTTCFENPDVFSSDGTPVFTFPGFGIIGAAGGFANREALWVCAEDAGLTFRFTKDMIFQFIVYAEVLSGGSFRFKITDVPRGNSNENFGLFIDDGVAKFFFSKDDGSDTLWLDWDDYEDLELYCIRIEYKADEEKAYFYVNDELIGSLACQETDVNRVLYIEFQTFSDGNNEVAANVSNLSFQLQP